MGEKKLTQKEQLKQDIASYNLQIIQLNNRINQLAGAKSYAEEMLKKVREWQQK